MLRNATDLSNLLGKTGDLRLEERVSRYSTATDLDYFFIFLYSIFLLSLFELTFRKTEFKKQFRAFFYALLSLLMFLDIGENLLINEILQSSIMNINPDIFNRLFYFSLSKWTFTMLVISIIGICAFIGFQNRLGKFLGVLLIFPLVLAPFFYFKPYLIELSALGFIPGLLMIWVYSIYSITHKELRKDSLSFRKI
jgi:hypothetical protein